MDAMIQRWADLVGRTVFAYPFQSNRPFEPVDLPFSTHVLTEHETEIPRQAVGNPPDMGPIEDILRDRPSQLHDDGPSLGHVAEDRCDSGSAQSEKADPRESRGPACSAGERHAGGGIGAGRRRSFSLRSVRQGHRPEQRHTHSQESGQGH